MSSKSNEQHGSLNIQKTADIFVNSVGTMVLSNPTGISIAKPASFAQATSLVTPVATTGSAGNITTITGSVNGNGSTSFRVLNPTVTTTSVIIVRVNDYSGTIGTNGIPVLAVDNVLAGGFDICVSNAHAGASISGTFRIAYLIL